MFKKSKILLSIFSFFLCSCTVSQVNSKIIKPPTKSFVKVIHTIEIKSCTDPKDKRCPIGTRRSSGSGMAIDVLRGKMTVITAGHVCDVGPTAAIKSFTQTVVVVDHDLNYHQAWPIKISQNNQKGAPDACLLYVPSLAVERIKISKKAPVIGEELYYIGAPMGIYHAPNPLIFKGIYSGIADASSALITAPATGGSSGSAVLNMQNEIVGIIWGSNPRFPHATVMTNYRAFINFINLSREKMLKDLRSQ